MKKILIFSVAIAMLVCAGCGTTSNTSSKSTVATTETTEEVVYKDPITYTEYETLDAPFFWKSAQQGNTPICRNDWMN